ADDVGDGDRLRAGGPQGDREGVPAGVGGGERVVEGQARLAVAAREGQRPSVIGRQVAVGVLGDQREGLGRPRGGRTRHPRKGPDGRYVRDDLDRGRERERGIRGVRDGERLRGRGLEGDEEEARAANARGEGGVGGQTGLGV